jgi:hypothetical protein
MKKLKLINLNLKKKLNFFLVCLQFLAYRIRICNPNPDSDPLTQLSLDPKQLTLVSNMFNNSVVVAGVAGAGNGAEKPDLQPRLPLLSPELHAARRPLRPHGLRPQLQRGPAG